MAYQVVRQKYNMLAGRRSSISKVDRRYRLQILDGCMLKGIK